jgi:hypothetical protein
MTVTINGTTGIAGVDGSAATPAVQGVDTNTGVYFPAADQVGLTAGGSQVLLVTASGSTVTGTESVSGNLSFNSGYGSAAVAYGCRAWVNFDGTTNTGGFCTIRGSGNVTSVADNGTGDYSINFTTAMPDNNYNFTGAVIEDGSAALLGISRAGAASVTTSALRVGVRTGAGALSDATRVCVSIFR